MHTFTYKRISFFCHKRWLLSAYRLETHQWTLATHSRECSVFEYKHISLLDVAHLWEQVRFLWRYRRMRLTTCEHSIYYAMTTLLHVMYTHHQSWDWLWCSLKPSVCRYEEQCGRCVQQSGGLCNHYPTQALPTWSAVENVALSIMYLCSFPMCLCVYVSES